MKAAASICPAVAIEFNANENPASQANDPIQWSE
jgi:hypothetical protein